MIDATVRVVCPACKGTGYADVANRLPKAREEAKCENCRGERTVPLITCEGCGRPAMEWDNPVVVYCGRDKCWEALTEVVDLSRKATVVPFRGYYGCGGGYTPFPRPPRVRDRISNEDGIIRCTNSQGKVMVWDDRTRTLVSQEDWDRAHARVATPEDVFRSGMWWGDGYE